jgi:DNA-binding response OmpR family regulator
MVSQAASADAKTVLVVEDEPAIRGFLSLALETERYRVATAGDGEEALSWIRDGQPDAILLDLLLPRMDGWSVIRSLEHDGRAGRIPIIAISAGDKRAAVGEHGVMAFLSKPFDLETLLVVLEDVLAKPTRGVN